MKANERNNGPENSSQKKSFGKSCLNSCMEALARINNAKEALLAEARDTLKVQEKLLRLALNEAEALAWQTLYPQLVFPDLAAEKIQGAAKWSHRQRSFEINRV